MAQIQDILSTPAVVAGTFALVGVFGKQLWDTLRVTRKDVSDKEDRENDKLEKAANTALDKRETMILAERSTFMEEQRQFRIEVQNEITTLREEVKQLREENIMLRKENVDLRTENRGLYAKVSALEVFTHQFHISDNT